MDVYKANPPGEGWVCAVLSLICVYYRFVFLRPLVVIDAVGVAGALMDIILDMGVVPLVVQSDQGPEFTNEIMAELVSLMGCRQVFSSSFHPQAQGIVERAHRTMTALLGILMETLCKGRPRRWPRFIRTLEARLRDQTFGDSGLTPRGVVNGWFNVTPLSSATGQVAELPQDLAYDEWIKETVREHLTLSKELDEVMDHNEEVRNAYANETRKGPRVTVGQVVFLRKGHIERTSTAVSLKLLAKCDGPYLVSEMPSDQNAVLVDPVTEDRIESCKHGRTVAVDRSIIYPVNREDLQAPEEPIPDAAVIALERSDVVGQEGIVLCQIDENHPQQQLLGVYPMESVGRMRVRDRQWKLTNVARMAGYGEVVCRITLEPTGVLSTASVEELLARGIAL